MPGKRPKPPRLIEIADEDGLYRRLVTYHIKPDGKVSSAAFKRRDKPDNEISVDLARLTTPQDCLQRAERPGFSVGELLAPVPRSLGFLVRHDPLEENYAHSLIVGPNDDAKCRSLAEATQVVYRP